MNSPEPFFAGIATHAAYLLAPDDVAALLSHHRSNPPEHWRGRWMLGGPMPAESYDSLCASVDAGGLPFRVTVVISPAGATYAVLTTQADKAQHRLVLPLYEPLVLQFLEALQHETYSLVMRHAEERRSMTVSLSEGSRDALRELRPFARAPILRSEAQAIGEFQATVKRLSRLTAISSLNGQPVERVCVSPLLPLGFFDSLAQRPIA